MTRVDYWQDDATKTYYLSVVGHAGYASAGNDIVCAGVSAVSYALLGFLLNAEEDLTELSQETEDGRVVVLAQGNDRICTAFEMALIGYLQIEKQYPTHVEVHIADKRSADSWERP